MKEVLLILEFLGGILTLFSICWIIGYLLNLDKKYEEMYKKK